MPRSIRSVTTPVWILCLVASSVLAASADKAFDSQVVPILERYCIDCHDESTAKGDLDFEQFPDSKAILAAPETWEQIYYSIQTHLMPPNGKKKPSLEQRKEVTAWIEQYLFFRQLSFL